VFELTPTGGSWTETVLHSFDGTDGGYPYATPIFDVFGNLYGTTSGNGGGTYGYGTVFELTPSGGNWTETVLHSFVNDDGTDGQYPEAGLILDANGNLYGTTVYGGSGACNNYGTLGCGTVFILTLTGGNWTETVLHNFSDNGLDGSYPVSSLIIDTAGNLYGTTIDGGTYSAGTVFEINP
jgi:uncharacterized repeat protein (TIGR03803 family)